MAVFFLCRDSVQLYSILVSAQVDVLVRNTQEIMQFVIQAVEAAESACLKVLSSGSSRLVSIVTRPL